MPCVEWAEEVAGDLAAGARWVLTEGRESGTVGIYDESGPVREDVIDAVLAPLTAEALTAHFLGREAYRHTRFIVARAGRDTAVVRVTKGGDPAALFSPIAGVEVVALPDECVFVTDPEVDTGIPSALAKVARERAPAARCGVVEGRYHHI